jgi:hypothetical protein
MGMRVYILSQIQQLTRQHLIQTVELLLTSSFNIFSLMEALRASSVTRCFCSQRLTPRTLSLRTPHKPLAVPNRLPLRTSCIELQIGKHKAALDHIFCFHLVLEVCGLCILVFLPAFVLQAHELQRSYGSNFESSCMTVRESPVRKMCGQETERREERSVGCAVG